jgi:hypothetical protein
LKPFVPFTNIVRIGVTLVRCFFSCVLFSLFIPQQLHSQTVTTGKSYINISRPNGGTFLPGDTIEVRATIAVTGGSNTATTRINSIRYNDTINIAKLTYLTGSLKMLNNEGRPQRSFSDAADTDSANIDIPTGRLRFNIGATSGACDVNVQGTSITNAGFLWGALMPTFYGSSCIRVFVYRAQIKKVAAIVDIDTTVLLSSGNFRYRFGSTAADSLSNFSVYKIKIAPDYGLCSNAIGTNALISESGGTFGSGHNKNRITNSPLVPLPYTRKMFTNGAPNDNFYGLANNTSGTWSTNPNLSQPNAARVFNIWDIMGDHTGAAIPANGNLPTDTTVAGRIGGYALIINASYETNRAFDQTITNLCENTYYEFAAWFKNICRRCGCDSTGKGAGSAGYVPGPGNDSSGVRPNLSFTINGEEYYTSGNLKYDGYWIKKGFVYRTKAGQTSMNVTIRNNAPGGGGNDWAIDDIAIATCLPNMKYSPSITPTICSGNAATINDTVRSFFNNYTYYKWQRSTDGGVTWVDVTAPVGPVVPVWNGTAWEYVSSYTIPPAFTTVANSGNKYRVVVATSLTNLSDVNCRSTDPTTIVTINVINCGPPLSTTLIAFTGKLTNGKATLKWSTNTETEPFYFDIERSYNGTDFSIIGTINSANNPGAVQNNYSFLDPDNINGKAFYRIVMRTNDGQKDYSRTLQLTSATETFSFSSVINPFVNALLFDVVSAKDGVAKAELIDQFGKPVKNKSFDINSGVNQLTFDNTSALAPGIYILRVEMAGTSIYKRVMKQNH